MSDPNTLKSRRVPAATFWDYVSMWFSRIWDVGSAFLPAIALINCLLLIGILTCLIIIILRPAPHFLTSTEYAKMDKNTRASFLPVVAVRGGVEVDGEIPVRGTVQVDPTGQPLDVVVQNASLKVEPADLCDPFPVKLEEMDGKVFDSIKSPIKTDVMNLEDSAHGIPVQIIGR